MPTCPNCGQPLPPNSPENLCRACLLKRAFETNTVLLSELSNPNSEIPLSSRWTPPPIDEVAARFPELEIIRLIGRGGMGAVYLARQKNLDRIVALKILPPAMVQDAPGGGGAAFAERFTREAQAMARLNHPHIVAIHEFGERSGQWSVVGGQKKEAASGETPPPSPLTTVYYFLMEYVDGLNLRALLDSGHVSPKEALAIVPQICDALQYAHDQGIVHRDIKPENILLNQQGQVKIADFGLAKLMGKPISAPTTSPVSTDRWPLTTVAGTPQYMAPEQFDRPAKVDHRADIYSLGVVFYQMLTGQLPLSPLTPPSQKVLIDIRLDQVVLRALEKDPNLRYQQATEVKTQIETITTTLAPSSAISNLKSQIPPGAPHGNAEVVPKPQVSTAPQPIPLATRLLTPAWHFLFFFGFIMFITTVPAHALEKFRDLKTHLPAITEYALFVSRFFQNIGCFLIPLFLLADIAVCLLCYYLRSRRLLRFYSYALILALALPALFVAIALKIPALTAIGTVEATHVEQKASDHPEPPGPIPVITAAVRTGDLPIYLDRIGTITANAFTVRSRVDGELIAAKFTEGQLVHEGDVLFVIDHIDYQRSLHEAGAQLDHDTAIAKKAQRLADSDRSLSSQVISRQAVDNAIDDLTAAQAVVAKDQSIVTAAEEKIASCTIRAPITGRIGMRLFDPGNHVRASENKGLAVITQLQPITCIFNPSQDDLPRVQKAMAATTSPVVEVWDRNNQRKLATGTLAALDNQIDPATGTFKLKAIFPNQDKALFPNQFVFVRLLLETRYGVTLVPDQAVQQTPQSTFVYVVTPDQNAAVRPVTVGPSSDGSTEITAGLAPGETVVTAGVDKLHDGQKVHPILSTQLTTQTAPSPAFTPVIELSPRIETASLTHRERNFLADGYINFRLGRVVPMPEDLIARGVKDINDAKPLQEWIDRHADAACVTFGDQTILTFNGIVTAPAANDAWQNSSPQEIRQQLDALNLAPHSHEMNPKDHFPATFLFHTKDGDDGILQILGYADARTRLKLRYKLLQPFTTQPASSNSQRASAPTLQTLSGTYRDADSPDSPDSLTILPDGTFMLHEAGQIYGGTCTFENHNLVLRQTSGPKADRSVTYVRPGDGELIDAYGNHWRRTPAAPAANALVTQSYDIRDLLNPDALPIPAEGESPYSDRHIGEFTSLIKSHASPDSWRSDGGTIGTISHLNGILVITTTPAIQKQVADLLKILRAASPDQVVVEKLAVQMLGNIESKLDDNLQEMATDKFKGWRKTLPETARKLREQFLQKTQSNFSMKTTQTLVQANRAVVKCTGPKNLGDVYLVLFFIKTDAGWRNWNLELSPAAIPLSDHLKRDPEIAPPTSPPSLTTPSAAAATQPAAGLKLQVAEENLKRTEALKKIGRVPPIDYRRAKAARDIAAAELANDPAQVALINYQLAEDELRSVQAQLTVGRATPSELQQATQARDRAAAATQPHPQAQRTAP